MLLLAIFSTVPDDYPGDKNFNFLDGLHQPARKLKFLFIKVGYKLKNLRVWFFNVIKFTTGSCYLILDLGLTQRSLGAT